MHEAAGEERKGIGWPSTSWLLLIAILLAGAFLRFAALGPMQDMLGYDEAYNGLDILSLLRSPRLTPFLPGNNGRESLWCYLLTPFVAVLGARPFALRFLPVLVGTLTLAAAYALGKEILGKRGGLWVAAVLAVLYWHVHLSHLALRAILVPLIGALAFASLLRAHRTNSRRHWLIGGAITGLLGYAYFSAFLWILYALVLLGVWLIRERTQRPGALLAILVIAVVLLPMACYVLLHSHQLLDRPGEVGVLTPAGILDNAWLWLRAWLEQGDRDALLNAQHRPILDPYLAALFLAGLASLPFVAKRRWYSLWVLGLALLAIIPSLLSDMAPHSLRSSGLVLPIALAGGAGACAVEYWVNRLLRRPVGLLVPLVLLTGTGVTTYRDFHFRWLHDPAAAMRMEAPMNRAITLLAEAPMNRAITLLAAAPPGDLPAYFSPLAPSDPILTFRNAVLVRQKVEAFDSCHCQVVPDVPALYVSFAACEPDFLRILSPWVDMKILAQESAASPLPLHPTIFLGTPRPGALVKASQGTVVFGDALEVNLLSPLPSSVHTGSTIPIRLGIKALRPLQQDYWLFVHLYGKPTIYEGGPMWGQSDSILCATYPTSLWKQNETVIQDFDLSVPATVPAGQYTVAIGVYKGPDGPRLPVVAPSPQRWNYFPLRELAVVDASRERRFALPEAQYPLDVTFGEAAHLRGFDLNRQAVDAGGPLRLTLYWQAGDGEALPASYKVFAHLLGPGNEMVAQHDGVPAYGDWPTSSWAKGQVIVDTHDLAFHNRVYQGQAALEVGLYDPQSGQRLKTAAGEDRVVLPVPVTVLPQTEYSQYINMRQAREMPEPPSPDGPGGQ